MESALQVVLALGDYMHIQCHACIGGTNVRDDIRKLESGVQVKPSSLSLYVHII